MNLFSLLSSSAWEILLSKRAVLALYLLAGLAVLVGATSASLQFFGAYIRLHQFDTPENDFLAITVMLFLPYWLVAGLMVRACLQRIRLALWAHRAFNIAEYATTLSAAEAGFIVDSEYNHRELTATLVALHYKGAIQLTVKPGTVAVAISPAANVDLTIYEQQLLGMLARSSRNSYVSFRDPQLLMYGQQAQGYLIGELEARGVVRRERLPNRTLRAIFRFAYMIAGFVGAVNVYALMTQYHTVMSVGYPRYPVTSNEWITLAIVLAVVVGATLSGFWPRFRQEGKAYHEWAEAAGFLLYLRTVYRDRFKSEYLETQDPKTLQMLASYAIAFGVMSDDIPTIARLLAVS